MLLLLLLIVPTIATTIVHADLLAERKKGFTFGSPFPFEGGDQIYFGVNHGSWGPIQEPYEYTNVTFIPWNGNVYAKEVQFTGAPFNHTLNKGVYWAQIANVTVSKDNLITLQIYYYGEKWTMYVGYKW